MAEEARWYVVHTYSGYENKVKDDILKMINHLNMEDQILDVMIPTQKVTEKKNGEEKQSEKKMFPAYVLVKMIMNERTWYVVRNTRGVTGFVGPGSKPVPLTEEEVESLGKIAEVKESPFSVGDHVVINDAMWQDKVGVISEIHPAEGTAVVMIEMFGRDTPVDFNLTELEKV